VLQLADQRAQPPLGIGGVDRVVQRRPVGAANPLVQCRVVGQLRQEVPQPVHHPDAIGDLRLTVTVPFVSTIRPLIVRRRRDAHFP
jgi:hypothetical protein